MKKRLWLLLIPPVALVAMGYAWYRHMQPHTPAAIQDYAIFKEAIRHPDYSGEVARAKSAGIPTTLADIFPEPTPGLKNALPVYAKIHAVLKDKPYTKEEASALDVMKLGPTSAKTWAQARNLVAGRGKLLSLMHQVAECDECVTPGRASITDPSSIMLPEFAKIRDVVRNLTVQSIVMAKDGRPLDAVANQALGFRVADQTRREPTMMGFLTSIAANAITLRGMQRIMILSNGDPKVAAAVKASIEKDWRPQDLKHALGTEYAMQNTEIRYIWNNGPNALSVAASSPGTPPTPITIAPQEWNHFMDISATYMLRLSQLNIDAASLPHPQAAPIMAKLSEGVDANSASPLGMYKMVALILFPASGTAADKQAESQTQADVIRAAAAVFVWKSQHGAYPSDLADAMTPVPTDPFDLKPLRYRRTRAGFVVYSVGKTLKYDGEPYDRAKGHPLEVVFRYTEL